MQTIPSQFRFAVLVLAAALVGPSPSIAQTAEQRQVTETLSNWGIIGDWSLDCAQPPSRNNGYLNYVVQGGAHNNAETPWQNRCSATPSTTTGGAAPR